jgi:rSAM/selenodomain-associated transferase 1
MKDRLGIMFKYPSSGRVKTRLGRVIGRDEAARAYRASAELVLAATLAGPSEYERVVFYEPPEERGSFEEWLPGERLFPQRGADIGEKMSAALEDLLEMGAAKALIIGGDLPELKKTTVVRAFAELDRADVVVGPAADGGYYLIGMTRLHTEIFQDIPWSTERVYDETIRKIVSGGLTFATVETLQDMDTYEDYMRVRRLVSGPETASGPGRKDLPDGP